MPCSHRIDISLVKAQAEHVMNKHNTTSSKNLPFSILNQQNAKQVKVIKDLGSFSIFSL